jgi:SAM-dependent methyltransferase
LEWLAEAIGPSGKVVGIDLAEAHAAAAHRYIAPNIEIMEGDLLRAAFEPASFDFVWCVNTINHLRDPVHAIKHLATLLRPGGRIALGQSSLVPDMYFAWDSRLERLTNEAVRSYYRDRYGLEERDLASVRAVVGELRASRLKNITVRTVMLERVSPLDSAAESYLLEAIFRDTWGERLRPYLPDDDYAELARVCDPQHSQYALRRPDFHFLQTFTLAVGEI